MLTQHDLNDLLAYQPGRPVLSVYLNLDPSKGPPGTYKLALRQLLRPFEDQVPQDTQAALRFLEQRSDGKGRGLVMFSCQADAFFRSYPLAVPIRSRARVLETPFVKPLADILDAYGHFGVALVDKQRARLFYLHLGELAEETTIEGEEVRQTKLGGGSQAAGRRGGTAGLTQYSDEVTKRNLREAAQSAARFFNANETRRVLLGGTGENLAFFRESLPKAVQSLIIGSFPIDMTASSQQVMLKALQVAHEAELQRELALVERAVTAAAKQSEGVAGLEETLEAVRDGRVRTLVVQSGFRAPGLRCTSCAFTTTHTPKACPYCGGEMSQVPDAVELAIREVMTSGGEVEIVGQNEILEGVGCIAALLRY